MNFIHEALDSFAELGELIYQGSENECFVQPQRCLFLADQLTAAAWALREDFRADRLSEVSALRDLDTHPTSQATRLSAFGETIDMAVAAAEDTLRAITDNHFTRARQRVSEGIYLLWNVDRMLTGLLARAEPDASDGLSTPNLFVSEQEGEQ